MDDLVKNRTLLLYYVKLCASFQIHQWIQTGVTDQKRSIRVKIANCMSHVTLKFDGWHWKTKGLLSYAASSFVRYFKSIGEFKLELQSGNAQLGSKLAIFCPVWPWKFDGWHYKTVGRLYYITLSFVHHLKAMGEFKLELLSESAQLNSGYIQTQTQTQKCLFVICKNIHTITLGVWNPCRVYLTPLIENI